MSSPRADQLEANEASRHGPAAARTIRRWCNAHLSSQDAGVLVDQAGKRRRGLLLVRTMAQHHRTLHEVLHRHDYEAPVAGQRILYRIR